MKALLVITAIMVMVMYVYTNVSVDLVAIIGHAVMLATK